MKVPKFIIISGLPGSGKSTLASGIAKKLKIPVFSVDPIESGIISSGISRSFETGLAAYLVVKNLAEEQLKIGLSCIVDSVSPVKQARDMWNDLAKKYQIRPIIIECILEQKIHKLRMAQRVRNIPHIPETKWEDVEKRRQEYLPWKNERLKIDTSKSLEKNIKAAVLYINSK